MTHFDHVGLSVADLHAQAEWYAAALGLVALPEVGNPTLGLRAQYVVDPTQGWAIELLERRGSQSRPLATSPGDAILTRGYGHICLRVADVDVSHDLLLAAGATPISPPGPSPLTGVRIAYVADPEGNLIELVQRTAPLADQLGSG